MFRLNQRFGDAAWTPYAPVIEDFEDINPELSDGREPDKEYYSSPMGDRLLKRYYQAKRQSKSPNLQLTTGEQIRYRPEQSQGT